MAFDFFRAVYIRDSFNARLESYIWKLYGVEIPDEDLLPLNLIKKELDPYAHKKVTGIFSLHVLNEIRKKLAGMDIAKNFLYKRRH